jgi:hypothetical protein
VITTMSFYDDRPQRVERVTRAAPDVSLNTVEAQIGLRSEAEAKVFRAIKAAGSIGTEAGVQRAAGLNEIVTARVIRSLQERGLIRRSMNGLGSSAFTAAR